jgi:transposase
MPRFSELDEEFVCPYRHGCPYLEGLSPAWVWEERQADTRTACHYEYVIEQLHRELAQAHRHIRQVERESQQLRAQLQALHRRQFKGRRAPPPVVPEGAPAQKKKRGAPVGHPPWVRPRPKHIDQVVPVPAPKSCPRCGRGALLPVEEFHEHVQEDIVLEPRTVAVCYLHRQAYCPRCGENVLRSGPGELLGCYIGPAAKATEAYLRQELGISYRKISRFFAEFFGLKFVPASAYGFERQAVRRGLPLYEDLRQKIRALPVAHGDQTSWRHNGDHYYVWYGGNEQVAFFVLAPDRSGQTAQSIFGEHFAGILVSDAYAGYNAVHATDWQSCLFHIKNKAKELDQELALLKGKAADPPARQFCQQVRGWVHRACQAHRRLCRGPWRAEAARRKGRALRRQLRALCRTLLRYVRAEKFRRRLLGPEQKHLLTCFHRPKVPPTNSQAERSLRPVVILRHVIHCTRSPKGLENHSVLRSLFETARRQGKKPHQFFFQLFTQNTAGAQAALYRKPLAKLSSQRQKPQRGKPP